MLRMMRTRMDFIFWKGQKYFFSLALNNDKCLYEIEYKAFDMYNTETEMRSSVLTKCSIKEAL